MPIIFELGRCGCARRAGAFETVRPATDAASHALLVISIMVVRYQNISFRASCNCLSSLLLLAIFPKVPLVGFTFGALQFGWFRKSNTSKRNCMVNRSEIEKFFRRLASVVQKDGPRIPFRACVPNVPAAGWA